MNENMTANEPFLSLKGISKSFASVTVLRDIDLDIYPGEILALLGENGAGKSTLMKIIAGIYLLVIFGQGVKLGAVLYYTKNTLAELHPILSAAVVEAAPPPPAPVAAPTAPSAPLTATETPAPAEEEELSFESEQLFSFEDIMNSGILDEGVISSLEDQFSNLWETD